MSISRIFETIPRWVYMKGRTRLALIVVCLIILATIVVGARARFIAPGQPVLLNPPMKESTVRATVVAQGNSEHERVETELITITPTGFEPAEITRSKGRFFLEVDNRSGLSEFNIRLDSEHGNRVHQARVPRERLDWYQEVNLPPGRYVLTESNHPDWRFQLTITAH